MALLDRAVVRLLPAVPRPLVRRISSRYIAGPELGDAVRVVRELNQRDQMATVDVLGEEVTLAYEARGIADCYIELFHAIERERLDANVSVKLTALGLKLDLDACRENLERVVACAGERGNFVRIDMEDSSTTDATLRLYRELRESGRDNLGVVLQAMLRRTVDDVWDLADLKPSVRLVKGIYVEPPDIAFRDYEAVRASFLKALDALLEAQAYVAVATHDDYLIEESLKRIAKRRLDRREYEFQMLLGVREERAAELVRLGHRVRIYVPYGQHWYEYSLRRLQENPKIAGYVAADTFNRIVPRRNGA
jgi:proline dehydrogenase